jgi:hypothetical protein
MMLFAALILEREPLQWTQLMSASHLWLQNAGAVAGLGLAIWVFANLLHRQKPFVNLLADAPRPLVRPLSRVLALLTTVSLLGFLAAGFIALSGSYGARGMERWLPRAGRDELTRGDYILSAAGLCALLVALTPLFLGLGRLRFRRIWALARLSIKEAIRSRVVLVFAFMALVFLFADWFVPYRPEDQVRNYVRVVYWSITPLFLMMAGLLGSFSIPNDIKSQSIHTVVTKPVEKFEIVLGRFLGYALLLSAGLALITVLSLVYVARGVTEQAEEESFKARVPVFGKLEFYGTRSREKGESVGREWEYRGYISGPQLGKDSMPRQFAVWSFDSIPAELANREGEVTFEFTFDIFRLSKGEENKDIPCTFTFVQGDLPPAQVNDNLAKIREERGRRIGDTNTAQLEQELIEKYGVHEVPGVPVTDYHTQSVTVPAALFRRIFAAPHDASNDPTQLKVLVSVDADPLRQPQMLGMARRDLYLLADERPFWQNFFKGVVGMWCTHMLVLGVAVACSTYLSALISWLCTMFLFGAGMCTNYLQQLSENLIPGGGPAEAFFRVATSRVQAVQLDQSPATAMLQGTDQVFNWVLRRILNLIPDVNRFDLHPYVANGFDVPFTSVLVIDNLIPLVGYLLPWAIVAYYLMKYREIANPT